MGDPSTSVIMLFHISLVLSFSIMSFFLRLFTSCRRVGCSSWWMDFVYYWSLSLSSIFQLFESLLVIFVWTFNFRLLKSVNVSSPLMPSFVECLFKSYPQIFFHKWIKHNCLAIAGSVPQPSLCLYVIKPCQGFSVNG